MLYMVKRSLFFIAFGSLAATIVFAQTGGQQGRLQDLREQRKEAIQKTEGDVRKIRTETRGLNMEERKKVRDDIRTMRVDKRLETHARGTQDKAQDKEGGTSY